MRNTLILGLFLVLAAPLFAAEPFDIITNTTDHIFADIKTNRAVYEANPEKLEGLVNQTLMPIFDEIYAARLILGRQGRGVSEDKILEFATAMRELLVNRYAKGMLELSGLSKPEVLPMRGKNTDKLTRVRTRVDLGEGKWAPVDYSFRKTEQGWKVFDMTAEGISYILTYRNQIGPMVKSDGLDTVIEKLRSGNIHLKNE